MSDSTKINLHDIYLPPNLASLARILITPFVGYFLWRGTNEATLICFILLVVAALTDFLDGFLARRLNQITGLGLILDPLADKILTIVLIIELILFRDFPIWLAVIILARDVVIMILASRLVTKRDKIPSSNLTGKYYFGSIAFLLISYVIRFDFGIILFQYIVIVMLVLSSVNYGRMLRKINKGRAIEAFDDKTAYKIGRFALSAIIIIVYLYRLYSDNPF
jgi:CDP-diacylglycerol--glycerol-3-phosphate 3-phosphatidyltransferase